MKWATIGLAAAALLSIVLALYASWRWFRGSIAPRGPGSGWLRTYVSSALMSLVLVSALSPVTIQGWHLLIALPAACLPLTFWILEAWPGARRWLRTTVVIFVLLRLPETILLGTGHPTYRLDEDIAAKLQPRQQALLPAAYRK